MKRVVVTGIGLITALGTGASTTWERIKNGETGISKITGFDTTEFTCKIGGEVTDFNPENYIEKKEARRLARYSQFAIAAAKMAVEDSKLIIDENNCYDVGVLVSSGIGGLEILETQNLILNEKGPKRMSPFTIPSMIENMAAGNIAIYTGAKGPNKSLVTACASGTHSIGDSFEMIKNGKVKVMISGGTEACITPMGIGGFCAMKALATNFNDTPEQGSRPFSADRDGFVMGEGAGILVLEEMEYAIARGAKIYAEVVGYGETADANHITAPAPRGEGGRRSIKMALDEAGLTPEDVDYINAHGTSTYFNDKTETEAIKDLFGEHAYKLHVSSTKGATGHALGAAGGIEAAICILAMNDSILPPTLNYDNKDPELDLNYVPNKAVKKEINVAVSNSLGFGGQNGTIVLKKYTR